MSQLDPCGFLSPLFALETQQPKSLESLEPWNMAEVKSVLGPGALVRAMSRLQCSVYVQFLARVKHETQTCSVRAQVVLVVQPGAD